MRTLVAAAALLAASLSVAIADETEGLVLSYDPSASALVLTDLSVWELPADLAMPATLAAGDRVLIEYSSGGENGLAAISALTLLSSALPEGVEPGA